MPARPDGRVDYREASLRLDSRQLNRLVGFGVHHFDDDGRIFWLESEWDEHIRQLDREMKGTTKPASLVVPEYP